jgi:predicted Co/Zn/Cd cation transporter (cation efflux family)
MPLTRQTYRRMRIISNKSGTFWVMSTFMRALILILFKFFWFLRKMIFGTCVLIIDPLIISPFNTATLHLD